MTESIHPDTTLGHVALTVPDLERSLAFYQNVLGLQLRRRENHTAYLGAGQSDLLALYENPEAKRVPRTSGLYHFAILVPSRLELARSLRRLAEAEWPLQGFADHLVSEAIYLPDPDGNGIELYRDRPRDEWPRVDGRIQMATDPIDLDGIMAELQAQPAAAAHLDPQTVLGHMHLHVGDLQKASTFYHGVLGFDLIATLAHSAEFVSAGGYHHHIAYNLWAGRNVPPPPPDAIGLSYYVVKLPNLAELGKVTDRVRQAGLALEEHEFGLLVRDPARNGLVLTAS
jgi:catechol 2,3-dioxygenase